MADLQRRQAFERALVDCVLQEGEEAVQIEGDYFCGDLNLSSIAERMAYLLEAS